MQNIDWNDLRFFLVLSRNASYSAAAQVLGVDGTTVSRRLKVLERTLATQLVTRVGRGGFRLTEAGLEVARVAEATESSVQGLQESIGNADTMVQGRVRVTAVPLVVNHFLTTAVRRILDQHPQLEIHLMPELRNVNLLHREADIAVRLARPMDGGHQTKTRRIATLTHSVYESVNGSESTGDNPVWIAYPDENLHLPQAQWTQEEAMQTGCCFSNVRVGDLEGAIEAAAHGHGYALLPSLIGNADPRLRRVEYQNTVPMIEREVWALVCSDMLPLARIRVTLDWLSEIF